MDYRMPTQAEQDNVTDALLDLMKKMKSRTPEEKAAAQQETVDERYQNTPDGASADTGVNPCDTPEYKELLEKVNNPDGCSVDELQKIVQRLYELDSDWELHNLSPEERKPATPQTVKEKVENHPVGDSFFADFVRWFTQGKNPPETREVHEAKCAQAQSTATDPNPVVEKILYSKNSCTSNGESINYKVARKAVNWGALIKANTRSQEEAIEDFISRITNFVRDSYGGWNRITEIIVRDQHLIINRSSMQPVLDPKTVDTATFPMDSIDYIRDGAIAAFFNWGMLKYMKNLMLLDVDDLGFYEVNIGGRLKCGRRIGVSTLFDLCKNLETLILAGSVVTREGLNAPEATEVKKKLATHKRFHLFADGYKLNILENTSSLASWTFGNMKTYATNRGNKNLFVYCGGVLARASLAGAAGILSLGTHLIGGIAGTIKEAMTPITPEEAGLDKPTKP